MTACHFNIVGYHFRYPPPVGFPSRHTQSAYPVGIPSRHTQSAYQYLRVSFGRGAGPEMK